MQNIPPVNDEIDLSEVFTAIWKAKLEIVLITGFAIIVGVVFALNQPNVYRSDALLAPAESSSGGKLSSLAGQLGGIASMAGINLDAGSSNGNVTLALEVIKSRSFIYDFVANRNILPELMAAQSFDVARSSLEYDPDIYDIHEKKWVREVDPPKNAEPSNYEAYEEFKSIFSVAYDAEVGMVRIAIEHVSPVLAQKWVAMLVSDLNEEIKKRDVAEAKKSINYLTKKIQETELVEVRNILFKLLEEQEKTIMFSEIRDEYVFKTVDPAVVPEEKAKPNRAIIVVLACIFGFVIGIVYSLVKYFLFVKSKETI